MSFGFAPRNWAMCNGQFLPINQNQALFSLLGTMYGGNGQTTFALPDLRGQTPIHQGQQNTIGTKGGEQAHTLSISEMPQHTHFARRPTCGHTTGKDRNWRQHPCFGRGQVLRTHAHRTYGFKSCLRE